MMGQDSTGTADQRISSVHPYIYFMTILYQTFLSNEFDTGGKLSQKEGQCRANSKQSCFGALIVASASLGLGGPMQAYTAEGRRSIST